MREIWVEDVQAPSQDGAGLLYRHIATTKRLKLSCDVWVGTIFRDRYEIRGSGIGT